MSSNLPALATLLALALYMATFMYVGRQRGRHKIEPPAVAGPPEFERALRVQQNTLEQLILFLPALWLFARYVTPLWGGVLGLVWVGGRICYALGYWRAAEARLPGFLIGLVAAILLWLGAAIGCVYAIV